jgi:hypothetical protein
MNKLYIFGMPVDSNDTSSISTVESKIDSTSATMIESNAVNTVVTVGILLAVVALAAIVIFSAIIKLKTRGGSRAFDPDYLESSWLF